MHHQIPSYCHKVGPKKVPKEMGTSPHLASPREHVVGSLTYVTEREGRQGEAMGGVKSSSELKKFTLSDCGPLREGCDGLGLAAFMWSWQEICGICGSIRRAHLQVKGPFYGGKALPGHCHCHSLLLPCLVTVCFNCQT